VIVDNDKHFKKQLSPSNLTEFGIVRVNNDEHPKKHSFLSDATEFGIFNIFKYLH
jgi:hypothetical protein